MKQWNGATTPTTTKSEASLEQCTAEGRNKKRERSEKRNEWETEMAINIEYALANETEIFWKKNAQRNKKDKKKAPLIHSLGTYMSDIMSQRVYSHRIRKIFYVGLALWCL